jgi:hypothetical protein
MNPTDPEMLACGQVEGAMMSVCVKHLSLLPSIQVHHELDGDLATIRAAWERW